MSEFIYYFYDITGIAGFISNNKTYFYIKNALGDIIAIVDSNGSLIGEYVYDAWGKTLYETQNSVTIYNPFRYRSYYRDHETGFYYLQTRYYDPEIRRFISKDSISLLPELSQVVGQLNLYAYCGNNPIAYTDSTGEGWWSDFAGWLVTGIIIIAAIALVITATIITAGAATPLMGLIGSTLAGAGVGAFSGVAGSIVAQGGFANANPWQVVKAGGIGAAIGAVSGAASWGVGVIGQSVGQQFGLALSGMTHLSSGRNIAAVYGLTANMLMSAGAFMGGVVGGIAGGTAANYAANQLFGNNLTKSEAINQGVHGEMPMWIINLFNWLIA